MRTGLWVSGAGGSGILVGRKEDGTWSPPSGIMLHTAGLGFLVGVDIYDCVVVINSQKALDAFSAIRCTLGGEISAVAGPVGVGGVLETELHKRQAPVFTYLKSRGFYAGVQIDGTIIIERTDENERFYGERIGVKDILAGKVRHPPFETRRLLETIKSAQGDTDVDQSLIPSEPPPGDFEVEHSDEKPFGIPAKEDPDPFGVLALETAGLEIREAGTLKVLRPTSAQFEFNPSPTSPIYTTFRRSLDRSSIDGRSMSKRSSWRSSTFSSNTERNSTMVDTSTQTDFDAPPPMPVPSKLPPKLPPRQEQNTSPKLSPKLPEIPESMSVDGVQPAEVEIATRTRMDSHGSTSPTEVKDIEDIKPTDIPAPRSAEDEDVSVPLAEARKDSANSNDRHASSSAHLESQLYNDVELDSDVSDDEEAVVQEVHQATAPQVITRARMVTVAKPIAPKLPPRNPFRTKLSVNSDLANEGSTRDMGAGQTPVSRGQSPPPTPSLKNDMSSASSQHSLSSDEGEGLKRVSMGLQPKLKASEPEKKEEVISRPGSPVNHVPGGFH
jgi:lipid-binding SYLF domain-containing protein